MKARHAVFALALLAIAALADAGVYYYYYPEYYSDYYYGYGNYYGGYGNYYDSYYGYYYDGYYYGYPAYYQYYWPTYSSDYIEIGVYAGAYSYPPWYPWYQTDDAYAQPKQVVYPTCSDGTPYSACSVSRPRYCDNGVLVERAQYCGCPEGMTSLGDSCIEAPCEDGTPSDYLGTNASAQYCSMNRPFYCLHRQLVQKSSVCGCPAGYKEDGRDGCVALQERCYVYLPSVESRAGENANVIAYFRDLPWVPTSAKVYCSQSGSIAPATCTGSYVDNAWTGSCTATCNYAGVDKYPAYYYVSADLDGVLCEQAKIKLIPPLPTTGTVLVRVVDEKGLPVSGVKAVLQGSTTTTSTTTTTTTTTATQNNSTTLQPASEGIDTYVNSTSPDANYGNDSFVFIGNSSGSLYRGLISFSISSLQAGITITSARVRLYFDNVSGTQNVSFHEATADWIEGNGLQASGATWNSRNGTANWTAAGGDYNSTAVASAQVTNASPGWIEFDVTNAVQRWYSSGANRGLLVKAENESTGFQTLFYSSDYSNASYRPQLVVNYSYSVTSTQSTNQTTQGTANATVYTNSMGEALVAELLPTSYSITFEKTGYASAYATVAVAAGQVAVVQEAMQRRNCDVDVQLVVQPSCPSQSQLVYQIKLTNYASSSKAYNLSYTGLAFVAENTSTSLSPGETRLITLKTSLPADFVGGTAAQVTVDASGCTTSLSLPVCQPALALHALESTKNAWPGTKECFKLLVRNYGSDSGIVAMTANESEGVFSKERFTLAPNEAKNLEYCTALQAGATQPKIVELKASMLAAFANSFEASGTISLVPFNASNYAIDVQDCISVGAQGYAALPIKNNVAEGDYSLELVGADAIKTSIVQPNLYNFEKGSERTAYISFDASKAEGGDYRKNLVLKNDGRIVLQKDVCFRVNKTSAVAVSLSETALSVEKGSSASVEVVAKNIGARKESVAFETRTNAPVTASVSPSSLVLSPGEEAKAMVLVEASPVGMAGDYYLNVSAKTSNQTIVQTIKLAVVEKAAPLAAFIELKSSGFASENGSLVFKAVFEAEAEEDIDGRSSIAGLPEGWTYSIEPKIAFVRKGEAKEFAAAIVPASNATGVYTPSFEISSGARRVAAPFKIDMAQASWLSGFFILGWSGFAALALVALAALGAWLYFKSKQAEEEARESGGEALAAGAAARVASAVEGAGEAAGKGPGEGPGEGAAGLLELGEEGVVEEGALPEDSVKKGVYADKSRALEEFSEKYRALESYSDDWKALENFSKEVAEVLPEAEAPFERIEERPKRLPKRLESKPSKPARKPTKTVEVKRIKAKEFGFKAKRAKRK